MPHAYVSGMAAHGWQMVQSRDYEDRHYVEDPAFRLQLGLLRRVGRSAYPLGDLVAHDFVRSIYASTPRSLMPTESTLHVENVFVPYAAAAALAGESDYVGLGVPAHVRPYFRRLFQASPEHRGCDIDGLLDDPRYCAPVGHIDGLQDGAQYRPPVYGPDELWWVRAWPGCAAALATAVAGTGTGREQRHDAAAILRRTGQGFSVDADLFFDVFYYKAYGADTEQSSTRLVVAQEDDDDADEEAEGNGPSYPDCVVVSVIRGVITRLRDPRPEPVRRHVLSRPVVPPVSPPDVLDELAAMGTALHRRRRHGRHGHW